MIARSRLTRKGTLRTENPNVRIKHFSNKLFARSIILQMTILFKIIFHL